MFEILGIQIPADIALSDDGTFTFATFTDSDALKALGESVRDAAKAAARADGVTPEKLAEIKQAQAFAKAASAELTARAEATAAFEAERDAVLAELDAEDADGSDADDEDSDEEDDDAADGDAAELADDGTADEDEGDAEGVTASTWTPTAGAAANRASRRAATRHKAPAKSGLYADAGFTAAAGVDGKAMGEAFANAGEMGQALLDMWHQVKGGSKREPVAKTYASFKDSQILSEDPEANAAKFGGLMLGTQASLDGITAALCAPEEPLYELATTSSTARPVKGSQAQYQPKRGKVSVYPTPKLADIDEGRGIWTAEDDANPSATKTHCATITCATPDVYTIYGVYRCLTIKNMLAMTFPELVEAYLNRLGALTSRLAEETLLDAMVGSVNTKTVTAVGGDYGASIDVFSSILQITSLYREEERYGDQQFDAWLPRWVLPMIQIDVMRQRKTSGRLGDRLPSMAEVNAAFRDSGIDVTWTLDTASSWDDAPILVDGDDLPAYPTTVSGILAPKGNLRGLDRGDLAIGVAPGGIYRDNASNAKNEFTIFQESFEGLMDFGATNWNFDITGVCPNGTQVADVTGLVCSGS